MMRSMNTLTPVATWILFLLGAAQFVEPATATAPTKNDAVEASVAEMVESYNAMECTRSECGPGESAPALHLPIPKSDLQR